MSKTAQKIVEAIQHSLLGSFVVTLAWPSGYFLWTTLEPLMPHRFADVVLFGTFGIMVLFTLGAWFLGYLARPAYRTFSPRGELQPEPPSGFDVWRRLPEGGLRPPHLIRWLVTAAARPHDRKPSWPSLVLFLANLALLGALHFLGDERWSAVHHWLGSSHNRDIVSLVSATIFAALLMRAWATEQLANLAPLDR